jgi:(E)-4-hydroxy-3-methylbut-2-enyl-diphosphate synthase
VAGVVRNTAALVPLLAQGLCATVRVSLSDTMENEVIAAREILLAAGEMKANSDTKTPVPPPITQNQKPITQSLPRGKIISCPRCGRCGFDTHAFTARWLHRLYALKKNVTIAVMGCAVNGPGEARCADLGITGAGSKTLIFRKGKIIHTIDNADADKIFEEELEKW